MCLRLVRSHQRTEGCLVLLLLILVRLPSSNTPVFLQLLASAKYFNSSAVIAPFRLVSSLTAKTTCTYTVFGRGAPCIVPPACRFPPTTARAASRSLASRLGDAVWAFSGEPAVSLGTWLSEWGCNIHQTQSSPDYSGFLMTFSSRQCTHILQTTQILCPFLFKNCFPHLHHRHLSFSWFIFWLTFSSVIDLFFFNWC